MPFVMTQPNSFPIDGAEGKTSQSTIDTYFGRTTVPVRTGMSVSLVRIEPGQVLQEHYHRLTEETFVVVKGQCTFVVDGQAYSLLAGACIAIAPGERHSLTTPPDCGADVVAVSVPAHDPDDFIVA